MGRNIAANVFIKFIQLNTLKVNLDLSKIREPLYDIEELNYIVSPDHKKTFDSRYVLARILDGSEFQ